MADKMITSERWSPMVSSTQTAILSFSEFSEFPPPMFISALMRNIPT